MKKDSKALALLKRTRYELLLRQRLEAKRAQLHSSLFPGSMHLKTVLVQESAPDDKMLDITTDVDDLDYRITWLIASIRRRRVYVESLISQIDNVVYRQILEMYYCTTITTYEEAGEHRKPLYGVARLSLRDVASRLGRSHGRIKHLHREAVRAFEKVYEKGTAE